MHTVALCILGESTGCGGAGQVYTDMSLPCLAEGIYLVAEDCAGVVEDAIGNKGAAGGFLNTAGVVVVVPVRPPNRPAVSTRASPAAVEGYSPKVLSNLRTHHPDTSMM